MTFEKTQINSVVAELMAFFASPEELKNYLDEKKITSFLIWSCNNLSCNNYVVGSLRCADDGSWLAYIKGKEVPVSFDTYISDLLKMHENLNLCYKDRIETIDELMEV